MAETVYLTKRVKFSAAHYFYLERLSPKENFKRFGPSANTNAHGHNYVVEVTVKGPCDPETGMVMNLKDIKILLDELIVQPLHFKNLNKDVPAFETQFPTLENVAVYLWRQLTPRIGAYGLALDNIRIAEDEDLYVEYFGEGAA